MLEGSVIGIMVYVQTCFHQQFSAHVRELRLKHVRLDLSFLGYGLQTEDITILQFLSIQLFFNNA